MPDAEQAVRYPRLWAWLTIRQERIRRGAWAFPADAERAWRDLGHVPRHRQRFPI
jgi:hypothetical protein